MSTKKFIQNWLVSTKFYIQASHKNNVGTKVDEKTHSHLWSVEIMGQFSKLNKNSVLFNFKTIGSFIFDILNDKDLNDILENREKHLDRRFLPDLEDVSNEPSNETIAQLIGKLVTLKITLEDPDMKGTEITVNFNKEDGIKENEVYKSKKLTLSAETRVQYSIKELQ